MVTLDGLDTPVGPGSTIAAVAVVNSLKVRIAELLVQRDAMPPVITRSSVVGEERSRALFDQAYREHARRIARAIDQHEEVGDTEIALRCEGAGDGTSGPQGRRRGRRSTTT